MIVARGDKIYDNESTKELDYYDMGMWEIKSNLPLACIERYVGFLNFWQKRCTNSSQAYLESLLLHVFPLLDRNSSNPSIPI